MFTFLCLKHSRTSQSLFRVFHPRLNHVFPLKSVHIKLRDNEIPSVLVMQSSILWQRKHALMQPQSVFYHLSVPSLLLHYVIVDHEPRPEAAVPARLQRRAKPHREEFRYWHSVRQLRVFSLRLQQFQLSRLQLSLRTGAGTSTDMIVLFTQASRSSHSAHVFVFRRSLCLVWSWLWCVMCLKCFTSWLTWMSPGIYALF